MRLCIDTDIGAFVGGFTDSTREGAKSLFAGDILPVEVHFFARTGSLDPFYSYLDVSGWQSVKLAVGVIGQAPAAECSTWAETAIQVVERVKGGTGINEIQRISISPAPGAGTFTLSFGGYTTAAIPFDSIAGIVKATLEALASIGSGNVSATKVADCIWDVEFVGTLAQTDVAAITADPSGLSGSVGILHGSLDLTGAGIDAILDDEKSASVTLEVEVEPTASTRATLVQASATLYQDLIDNSEA